MRFVIIALLGLIIALRETRTSRWIDQGRLGESGCFWGSFEGNMIEFCRVVESLARNSAGFRNGLAAKTSFCGNAMNLDHWIGFPAVELAFWSTVCPVPGMLSRSRRISRAIRRVSNVQSLPLWGRFNLFSRRGCRDEWGLRCSENSCRKFPFPLPNVDFQKNTACCGVRKYIRVVFLWRTRIEELYLEFR